MSSPISENYHPCVSVIIPSYNHARFIIHAIESVISQTYLNIELLIIDDGSTDESDKVITSLKERCENRFIKYQYIKKKNSGLNNTLNLGLQLVSTEFVSFLASDDAFLSTKIEKQVRLMKKHPNMGMCYGRCNYIDEEGHFISFSSSPLYKSGRVFEDIIMLKYHPPVNYMHRRNVLLELGGYRQGIVTEDYYMNCRIAEKYEIGFIDEVISEYRIFQSALFKRDPIRLFDSQRQVIDLFSNHPVYKAACLDERIRRFSTISSIRKFKIEGFKLLPQVLPGFMDIRVIKGIIKLFFFWRNYSSCYTNESY